MVFQDFGRTEKKLLLLALSLLFCYWLFAGSATASASGTQEAMYQITESELTTLENNLAQLRSINEKLQRELAAQKQELHVLREESSVLVKQLNELKSLSAKQEDSLTSANKLLEQYAIEEKNKRLRVKAQRNAYFIGMVAATVVAVCHR
jgi:septal ring factor EnvC (AmiA/AmiB activator)